jgi:mannose-1-phosphate guanylyltransferase
MRIVIFAGGSGRRLWPISRVKSPKQFEPIVGDKSTLQMAVGRVLNSYGADNVFISTNLNYVDMVRRQLPELPPEQVIGEPVRRDLAAAVGLALVHLLANDPAASDEPMAIIWGDSYVSNTAVFLKILKTAASLLQRDVIEIFFVGETPRFANQNLGWLELGEALDPQAELPSYRFSGLTYRPPQDVCEALFAAGTHVWNTGYFITTPRFVSSLYEQYQPEMWAQLTEIGQAVGRPDYLETLNRVYPLMDSISFDDAILAHMPWNKAAVLHDDLGWSDPGTLYALKEALQPDEDQNLCMGRVVDTGSRDSLIYNYDEDKLLVAIGLDGMIVVNTEDAILVVHKDQIPLVKKVVDGFESTDLETFS